MSTMVGERREDLAGGGNRKGTEPGPLWRAKQVLDQAVRAQRHGEWEAARVACQAGLAALDQTEQTTVTLAVKVRLQEVLMEVRTEQRKGRREQSQAALPPLGGDESPTEGMDPPSVTPSGDDLAAEIGQAVAEAAAATATDFSPAAEQECYTCGALFPRKMSPLGYPYRTCGKCRAQRIGEGRARSRAAKEAAAALAEEEAARSASPGADVVEFVSAGDLEDVLTREVPAAAAEEMIPPEVPAAETLPAPAPGFPAGGADAYGQVSTRLRRCVVDLSAAICSLDEVITLESLHLTDLLFERRQSCVVLLLQEPLSGASPGPEST